MSFISHRLKEIQAIGLTGCRPGSFQIQVNDLATENRRFVQIRFPRSKKKRIRKKWRKRPENWGWKTTYLVVRMGSILTVHSKTYEKLMGGLSKRLEDFAVDKLIEKKLGDPIGQAVIGQNFVVQPDGWDWDQPMVNFERNPGRPSDHFHDAFSFAFLSMWPGQFPTQANTGILKNDQP